MQGHGLDLNNMVLPECAYNVDSQGGGDIVANEFFMYVFKVQRCPKRGAHDWSSCPYAHPKEKARRRDPRVYQYASTPCPESLKGINCGRGLACPYAHSVYEYWLHPARFRTQMCKKGNQCNRTLCFFAHSACELRFPDTSDDAEAAAVDAAAASATATPLPLCASTSSMSAVHPAAAATGSSATLLPQITAQPSSCSNSGLLLPNGMVGMSQASDALMGGGSSFYSGNSFGGMGSFCSQDLPGLGIGCSDPGVLIPGLAVDNSSCLSEPLARVNTDAAALMAATNTNGSSNVAAWLQLAAASQLPASQIRNSIRPPPSVQPQPPQPHSTALFANEIGRGVPDDFSGAAINSNAARAMQQLSVPGANVMGILNSGRARGVDSSADHVAAGFAGLNLQASATGFGAAAGAGLLVDDSSSSSCITSISGDQQQFLAALGLAVGMPQNAGLMVAPGGPGSSQAPGRAGSARAEDLMLLQQNLLRASTTGSMSNGMQNSGGLPTMLPHELQPQVAQVGGSTWLRIG